MPLSDLQPATANERLMRQAARARGGGERKTLSDYQAAQMVGMIPGFGMIGVAGDIQEYIENPETRGLLPYALTAAGALPFLGAMAKMAGKLPRGVRPREAGAIGYHGSPHKFEKFDMGKIGTGEGSQAYGHGLYFAENRAVANDYAQNLAAKSGAGGPNLYKVDIPDESIGKMLDWDKPVSAQSEHVKAALKNVFGELPQDRILHLSPPTPEMSAKLRAAGIPGIKYLDQGSRSAGKGSYNYVVFDDALPKIIGRE